MKNIDFGQKQLAKIVGKEVINKLNNHTSKIISLENENLVAQIDPYQLIHYDRFDLMAKYIYAKYRELGIDSDWALSLYCEHLRVWCEYEEGDGSGKSGKDTFINIFNQILDSVKNDGFDENISIIPVDKRKVIIDGAHRVAACLFYKKEVSCLLLNTVPRFRNIPLVKYDYLLFQKLGLANKFSDPMAIEYCKLKKNTYIGVVFPSAVGKDQQIRQIFQEYGCIFYEKSIYLINEGPVNLIKQLYLGESWLGSWENNFDGARTHAALSFNCKGFTRIFAFESDSLEKVQAAKNNIRELFSIGKSSIHINDTHEETVLMAQFLFNENSIHFLNYAHPRNFKNFYKLFNHYKKWLEVQNLDKDCFCIDGSSVMSVYGIREAQDLDFLHRGYDDLSPEFIGINSHNHEVIHYGLKRDEIIYNPDNFFYYDGVKFVSLALITDMKKKRGEAKDVQDIHLIDKFINGNQLLFWYFQLIFAPRVLIELLIYKTWLTLGKVKRFINTKIVSLIKN